jgi:hypothetical protein
MRKKERIVLTIHSLQNLLKKREPDSQSGVT